MNKIYRILTYLFFFSSSLLMSHEMKEQSIQAVILAAGRATRFKTNKTKLIEKICGQEMILYPVMLLEDLGIKTSIVVGFEREKIVEAVGKKTQKPRFIVQEQQLGTGHALLCTQRDWEAENILLLNGDMPLISKETITNLIDQHIHAQAGISFVVSHNTDTSIGYGRLVTKNGITRIVEAKHFTYTPEEYPLVNAGIFIINRAFLEKYLSEIQQNEVTNEFYVTDLVELASKHNIPAIAVEVPFDTLHGVNTFNQLAKAEHIKQKELINYWMAHGVCFENPKTTHLDLNVVIEAGSFIGNGVELRGATHIGKNCIIKSYSILNNIQIADNSVIEPYTHYEK